MFGLDELLLFGMAWTLLGLGFSCMVRNTVCHMSCRLVNIVHHLTLKWSLKADSRTDVFHIYRDTVTVLLPPQQAENFVHVVGEHEQNLELVCSVMLHGRAWRFTGLDMGALSFSLVRSQGLCLSLRRALGAEWNGSGCDKLWRGGSTSCFCTISERKRFYVWKFHTELMWCYECFG